MISHVSTTLDDLKKIDWTNSKIVSARIHTTECEVLNTADISWSDFRYNIFKGIHTSKLLENFSSVTTDTNRGTNWKPFNFLQCTFYIRYCDANQVMNDILKAFDDDDGDRDALYQGGSCFFKVRFPNGVEHTIYS
jgi:hypothetical protein